jgi:hypothetical protein
MKGTTADGKSLKAGAALAAAIAVAFAAGALFIRSRVIRPEGDSGLVGSWAWSDSSLFEFQRLDFRFTPDSFYMAQRYIDPANPRTFMPCSLPDHKIYAAGGYTLKGDTLRFRGDFTDPHYSRDTLRLCRDTGFKGRTQIVVKGDTLCLRAGPAGKPVCLGRLSTRR